VTGEDSSSGPVTGVATERPEYRQESWNYPTGYLTSDQRHRAKLWVTYDQPTPIDVRSGKPFVSIPYSLELNDTIAYVVNKVEPRRYGQMIKDAFDVLYDEGAASGTVMCIPTHNYLVSHPHRLKAFEGALEHIAGRSDVWLATGREIAQHYLDTAYDAAVAAIAAEAAATHAEGTR
jgi:hypothetical protein